MLVNATMYDMYICIYMHVCVHINTGYMTNICVIQESVYILYVSNRYLVELYYNSYYSLICEAYIDSSWQIMYSIICFCDSIVNHFNKPEFHNIKVLMCVPQVNTYVYMTCNGLHIHFVIL